MGERRQVTRIRRTTLGATAHGAEQGSHQVRRQISRFTDLSSDAMRELSQQMADLLRQRSFADVPT
jgi:hypothetical protein